MERKKAIFINGGAGRALCAIPAIEQLNKTDKDFIIVSESFETFYKGHPNLHPLVYPPTHKNLFRDLLKDRELVSPEPYRVFEYYNQECNLIQAFNKEINGNFDLDYPTVYLTKTERQQAGETLAEIKKASGRDKVVVIQPVGRTAVHLEAAMKSNCADSCELKDEYIDESGRSMFHSDLRALVKTLSDDGWVVVIMSEFNINFEDKVIRLEQGLREWSAIIEAADYFIGCDSVGQHIARALDKKSISLIGATYPENISYPECDDFTIIDLGKDRRLYSPIRICQDEISDMINRDTMKFKDDTIDIIMEKINE